MTQYAYPDGPRETRYLPQGEITRIQAGDFFKCARCLSFHPHEGQLYALSETEAGVQFCCATCRASVRLAPPWPQKTPPRMAAMSAIAREVLSQAPMDADAFRQAFRQRTRDRRLLEQA
jgi:hypothetical protein